MEQKGGSIASEKIDDMVLPETYMRNYKGTPEINAHTCRVGRRIQRSLVFHGNTGDIHVIQQTPCSLSMGSLRSYFGGQMPNSISRDLTPDFEMMSGSMGVHPDILMLLHSHFTLSATQVPGRVGVAYCRMHCRSPI